MSAEMPEGNMTEIPKGNGGTMYGESAEENADFHTSSESIEGYARGDNSIDNTGLNNGQETKEVDEFNTGDETMSVVMQMSRNKLEEFADWFLHFACQGDIVQTQDVADGNILNIKKDVVERFKQLEQPEEMCVVLEAQMVGTQIYTEEMLAHKDDDAQQEWSNLELNTEICSRSNILRQRKQMQR
jgi:hypothetical protein